MTRTAGVEGAHVDTPVPAAPSDPQLDGHNDPIKAVIATIWPRLSSATPAVWGGEEVDLLYCPLPGKR